MNFQLTPEQSDIKAAVEEFCQGSFTPELARECDREEKFPHKLHREAARLGFIGIHLPEEYGGGGYGLTENVIVAEAMCRADSTLGTALILTDLGCELIDTLGSPEQKGRHLRRVANGEAVSSIALTEPARGSALSERLDTTATRAGEDWTINGGKTLITNAPIAQLFVTLCQSDLAADPPYRGQSLYIIDGGAEGVEVREIKGKMGIRAAPLGEVTFENVRLPEESLLGELDMGFYETLEFFNSSRVEIAAQALGIAEGALDRALAYSKEREVSGTAISELQAISHKLADMAIKVEGARLLVYKAAWLVDRGRGDPMVSSMAKARAGKVAVEVADEAVQILGGYGYIAEYDVERGYRDAKITEIYEGTREIQRNTVTRFLLRR
ncbi:MAG: acyl-CoA dehydrogenase family protein [Candidatus Bathyarchaeota archaeon]|jgi:alkylation response protein AidB-like acyl-CoA dehydrogenase